MSNAVKKFLALGLTVLMMVSAIQPNKVLAGEANSQNTKEGAEDYKTGKVTAFPGAEGGGAYVSGGRGGDVYIVTNLEDYKSQETPVEGSLRYGIETTPKAGRTIVFRVSGTILLERSLNFAGLKNITIAGQTAPGNGITIAGYDTNISNSENIMLRYVRFRPGAVNIHNGSDSMDALWGRYNKGFMVDHCSFSWNTDETLSLYAGDYGTVSWCLISESLTLSGHTKGRHGYGGIAGGNTVTYHHNMYADHTSRNPRLAGGYDGVNGENDKQISVMDFSNNVIYNWGFNTIYAGGYAFNNMTNNVSIAGPGTRDEAANYIIAPGEGGKQSGYYIKNNAIGRYSKDGYKKIKYTLTNLLDETSPYVNCGCFGEGLTEFAKVPYLSADCIGTKAGISHEAFDHFLKEGVTVLHNDKDVRKLADDILSKAGAVYPRRDAIDARVVSEVKNGSGRYINKESEAGGYVSEFGIIEDRWDDDFDSDQNGISDVWQRNHSEYDWSRPDMYKKIITSGAWKGYSVLEHYLWGTAPAPADKNPTAVNPEAVLLTPKNNQNFACLNEITVTVDAKANDKSGSIASVEIYNGSKKLGAAKLEGGRYSYTIPGNTLSDGSYFISARVTDTEGNQTQTTAATIHINSSDNDLLIGGWSHTDIGSTKIRGSASFINGILTVKGNGKIGRSEGSIKGTKEYDKTIDSMHMVFQKIKGNFELTARVEEIGDVDNHAFSGLAVRNSLKEDAASAVLGLSYVKQSGKSSCWSVYLAGRETDGGNFDVLGESLDSVENAKKNGIALQADIPFMTAGVCNGYWLKLVRTGNTLYAYGRTDKDDWKLIGAKTVSLKEAVYVGFAADSNSVANNLEQLNTARFSYPLLSRTGVLR